MFHSAILFLAGNPLLLLFSVVALGYPLSRIRIAGASLGIASILFSGIALGALVMAPWLDPAVKAGASREIKLVYELGLALFVYAMGLAIAQSFWSTFSREGIKKNAVVAIVLLLSMALIIPIAKLLGFNARFAAGLFTGTFNNMPALAGLIERVKSLPGMGPLEVAQPTVASAIAYPIGVIVPMFMLLASRRFFKVDLQEEAQGIRNYNAGLASLEVRSILVTQPQAEGMTHRDLREKGGCNVVFGRLLRDGKMSIAPLGVQLKVGDVISVVGSPADIECTVGILGEPAKQALERDLQEFDSARVFVSNSELIGRPLRELALPERYNGIITRLRRGDVRFVPNGSTVLELGDRVRVVTRRKNIGAIQNLFGDSYRELSEVSFLTFAMGLAAGLALGQVPIHLGHGVVFKLGFAGGPLIAALVLGRFHRIGPLVWNFPYSANHTIRQFGLVLFAAGIGIISGEGFRSILSQNLSVLPVFLGSALLLALLADVIAMYIGYKLFRIPMNVMFGILAGAHTQPVVLSYASQQTRNELPGVGFAAVYPLSTILKIILAQVLLVLVR